MRTIKASELSSFLYCQRAWWYQLKGTPSENQAELAYGTEFHQKHGRQILAARLMEMLGWGLVLAAVVALTLAITLYFIE